MGKIKNASYIIVKWLVASSLLLYYLQTQSIIAWFAIGITSTLGVLMLFGFSEDLIKILTRKKNNKPFHGMSTTDKEDFHLTVKKSKEIYKEIIKMFQKAQSENKLKNPPAMFSLVVSLTIISILSNSKKELEDTEIHDYMSMLERFVKSALNDKENLDNHRQEI